jgi:hypothetical protein
MRTQLLLATLGLAVAGCSPQVPNVVGLKAVKAEERLQRAGFKSEIRFEEKFEVPSGEVISQEPKGSDRAETGSLVRLNVAKGATITGTFTLIDADIQRGGGGICVGTGGYSDIAPGLQVTVKDGSGNILGLGKLGPDQHKGQYSEVACEYGFKVENIPRADFYDIEVGRRGSLKYSFEEIRKKGWVLTFTLGA